MTKNAKSKSFNRYVLSHQPLQLKEVKKDFTCLTEPSTPSDSVSNTPYDEICKLKLMLLFYFVLF